MEKLLQRYTESQRKRIDKYWETIRFTRKTCTVSDGIKRNEMEYWSKFPVDKVIEALNIHIVKYPCHRESYTRGIMRNIGTSTSGSQQQGPTFDNFQKPTFSNFSERTYDADELKAKLLKKTREKVNDE